jgi:hypothetical protein
MSSRRGFGTRHECVLATGHCTPKRCCTPMRPPARVAGGFTYVHVACTPSLTLFHVAGRSAADVDAGGVLPGFTGTLVRDDYAA